MKPSRQYLEFLHLLERKHTAALLQGPVNYAVWGYNKMFTCKLYEIHKYKFGKMRNLLLLTLKG
jgi:hypothetical protein